MHPPPAAGSGAAFSRCGRYRYRLWHRWAPGPAVLFVMLNPSTADAERDDPTIARCRRRAEALGFGAVAVGNLFAWRSHDPRQLRRIEDPVGPYNDRHLRALARRASLVICAWGNHGALHGRSRRVLTALYRLGISPRALGMTARGEPAHPLYLPQNLAPVPMDDAAGRFPRPQRPPRARTLRA